LHNLFDIFSSKESYIAWEFLLLFPSVLVWC